MSHMSEPGSDDQPLFVLKYRKRRMIFPLLAALLFLMPITCYVLFVHVAQSTFEFILVNLCALLLLLLIAPFFADMLLFKEIRLYKDRIVKEWKLIGTQEQELAKAGLDSQSMPTLGVGAKSFFEVGMNQWLRWLMAIFHSIGITYKEHLADRQQVKQLNSLLAKLSGRKVEEFEQTIQMEKLIKEEKS